MKSLSKKNVFVLILAFVFALSMFVFASTVTVKADDAATATGVFELVEGASIRIGDKSNDENGTGIRFLVRMSEDVKKEIADDDTENKVKLGFIITTKEIFEAREFETDEETGEEIPDYINTIGLYVSQTSGGIIVDEGKIYEGKDADAGYYMANAAVTQIIAGNETANYTAIAYIHNTENDTYQYALIDDFSRSIVETASKVYINGTEEDETTSLESLRCVQGMSGFGTEDNPVLINDSDDLYALSESVNVKERSFTYMESESEKENSVQFKLNKDVTVDWDFEQIGENFNGAFVESENKVEIVNNKDLVNIFDGATGATYNNVTCVNNTKLFNASERAGGLVNDRRPSEIRYFTGDELPKLSYDGTTAVGGASKMKDLGAVGLIDEANASVPLITMNYSATELEEMYDEYNKVKITFLAYKAYDNSVIGTNAIDDTPGLIDNIAKYYYGLKSGDVFGDDTWRTYMVDIQDFVSAMRVYDDDENTLYLTRFYTRTSEVATLFDFYISDITLEYDNSTIFSAATQVGKAGLITMSTSVVTAATYDDDGVLLTRGTYKLTGAHSDNAAYVSNDIIGVEGDTRDAIQMRGRMGQPMYAVLKYDSDAIKELAKQGGYNAITVTLMYARTSTSSYFRQLTTPTTEIADGLFAKEVLELAAKDYTNCNYNQWITRTFSIDEFTSYMGKECLFNSSYVRQNLPDYDLDSTSTLQAIPDNYVLLQGVHLYGTIKTTLVDISFTTLPENVA